ncbi:hypothetical protein [Paenibacillus sp. NEAU-GSW1]|uniref:hypothetical protein n=1 Tax=Paenibacillus sp. NEAU-GSW1 TaxID=2682486 RepID=UPI0012E207DA|nr:hypothetical protein [Paenibacillus sp. NEAU-GSW1]MUT67585.1 hypothetical protein [Paenibacillus sp. NEAU-GSW1]
MNMNKWKLMFSAAVIVAALTGCGANADTTTPSTAEVGELSDQQRPAGGMMMGGTLGKIKSIDGQTITIYTSSFNPGERPNGGGGGQQDGQAPAMDDGEMPQPPQDGEKPAGDGAVQGERPQRPEGGMMNMENMFTEETAEITVSDATQIISTTFENNERKETTLTLADLKADDVITITLKEGTQEAEAIRLGGFGGFGGGGMGGGRQQPGDQQGGAAATTTQTN